LGQSGEGSAHLLEFEGIVWYFGAQSGVAKP
jgi:hypothetical protein